MSDLRDVISRLHLLAVACDESVKRCERQHLVEGMRYFMGKGDALRFALALLEPLAKPASDRAPSMDHRQALVDMQASLDRIEAMMGAPHAR